MYANQIRAEKELTEGLGFESGGKRWRFNTFGDSAQEEEIDYGWYFWILRLGG